MIKFGSINVKDIRIGEQQVKKVAVGSEIVWEKNASPLPSGYTEVKYLQSSGHQYINTGVLAGTGFVIEMRMCIPSISAAREKSFISAFYQDQTTFYIERNANWCVVVGRNWVFSNSNPKPIEGVFYDVVASTISGDNYISIDGQTIIQDTKTTGNLNSRLYLFAQNRGSSGTYAIAPIIIGKNKLYDSTKELARDFIPCLDTNNTPCFYDTVTQQTFYNAGTGEFGYETMDGTVVAPT